ncbi:MAG TPA: hypothetical protein VGN12_05985 [Pirellulales bacterium]|jgi:hypothetical protein
MENELDTKDRPARSTSVLIAWLSVCMLAASWGARLGPEWVSLWREWGTFGLTAALGLNVADRLRAARRSRLEAASADRLLERRISTVIDEELPDEHVTCRKSSDRAHQLVM